MNKKHFAWIILFIVSFVVRLIYMNDGLFHHDTIQLARAVEGTLESGVIQPAVGGKYFLVFIYSLFTYIFHQSTYWSITFLTIFLASAAVVIIYFFVKELTSNEIIAFNSAILFSLNPLFLSLTTYAKSHALAVLCIVSAGFFLIKALKTDNICYYALFTYAVLISLMTRIGTMFFIPVFVLMMLWPEKIIKGIDTNYCPFYRVAYSILLALMIFLLYKFKLIYYYSMDVPALGLQKTVYLLMASFSSLIDALTIPIFIVLIFSIYYMVYKKKDWEVGFLLFWFLATFMPLAVAATVAPRYWLNSLIPLIIIVSYGIYYVSLKYRKIALAILIILLIVSLGSIIPVIGFRSNYCGTKELALMIKANSLPGDVIAIEGDYHPFVEYYSERTPVQLEDWKHADYIVVWEDKHIEFVNEQYYYELIKYNVSIFSYIGSVDMEDFHKASLNLKLREADMYEVRK